MAIDGINPFLNYNTNLGINQQVGGQGGQPKVNPFREIQPVEGTQEVGRGSAWKGFNTNLAVNDKEMGVNKPFKTYPQSQLGRDYSGGVGATHRYLA